MPDLDSTRDGASRHWRLLVEVADLPADIDAAITETLDWFDDEPRLGTEEFIDRLCKSHGGDGYGPDDWDIEKLDAPAVREIMRRARAERRDRKAYA